MKDWESFTEDVINQLVDEDLVESSQTERVEKIIMDTLERWEEGL